MKWSIFFSSAILAFSSCNPYETKEFEELQHICEKNLERESHFIYTDNAWRAPFLEKELDTLYADFNRIRLSPDYPADSLNILLGKHGKHLLRWTYQNESALQYFPDPVKTSFPGFDRINLLLMKNTFADFYASRLTGPCFTPSNMQVEPIVTCFSAGDSLIYLGAETHVRVIHWIEKVEFHNRQTLQVSDAMQWAGKIPVPSSLSANINPYDGSDISGIVKSMYNTSVVTGKRRMIVDRGQYVPLQDYYELFR